VIEHDHILVQTPDTFSTFAQTRRYRQAARRTTSVPERRYLEKQAAKLTATGHEKGTT
jgi:hypothetical protein